MSSCGIMNECMVGVQGDKIVVLRPKTSFTREQALGFAAWLVALAENEEGEFAGILKTVQGT